MTDTTGTEPFRFTDADGDYLHIGIPTSPTTGHPAISFCTLAEPVHVPVEQIEGLITALRRLVAAQSAVSPAAVEPPADQTALRDRIRLAIARQWLDEMGSDRTVDELDDAEFGEFADAVLAVLPAPADQAAVDLETARATNQRLNREKQRLESELAAYRRAVSQWEISERGTYVPLRSLAGIAKAAGIDVPARWQLHYERVERAEAERDSLGREADRLRKDWVGMRDRAERAEADRATVLREAADVAETVALRLRLKQDTGAANGAYEVMEELRRMADETATETPEDPARIDRLRPEFTEHASVEAIDAQLDRARRQERRWHLRAEWLIGLRQARADQPAAGARQDGSQP